MKWSKRLALMLAAPLALMVAGLMLPATAAWAWTPTCLVFTVQPTTTQVNTVMKPSVVVEVQWNGQVDTEYNGPVTLTYADNPVGAPEPASNSVNADQGVATFSGLAFSAVGFGFKLEASIPGSISSSPSAPFDIVTQLVKCQSGKPCHSETVSSAGTSGSVKVAAGKGGVVLTATGGGFSTLSCTSQGGVVSFSVAKRSKVITVTLHKPPAGTGPFSVCYGSPTPFIDSSHQTAGFNQANGEFEGTLGYCWKGGPSPCIKKQTQKSCDGPVVTTIDAPPGDPRISY
ncbi:MAG TPA: hypothetical protein VHZ33_23140 [Trebonia sp.]|nr:hypothetical protein [Trebonia sp.]